MSITDYLLQLLLQTHHPIALSSAHMVLGGSHYGDILEQMLPSLCGPTVTPLPSSPLLPYPIRSCHLHYHLGGGSAEVAAVAAHHHGAALPVPQVDGGQHALDVVLQVVLLPLEHRRLPPQPVGAGPLVLEGGGLDRQHRDGARLHPPSEGAQRGGWRGEEKGTAG